MARTARIHYRNVSETENGYKYDPSSRQKGYKYDPSMVQVRSKYDPSSPQIEELIMHMNGEFMSMKSMIEACNLKSRKRFREYYVTSALNDNAIERKYPDEPNHPKQMYRLTAQAIEWKNSLKK